MIHNTAETRIFKIESVVFNKKDYGGDLLLIKYQDLTNIWKITWWFTTDDWWKGYIKFDKYWFFMLNIIILLMR